MRERAGASQAVTQASRKVPVGIAFCFDSYYNHDILIGFGAGAIIRLDYDFTAAHSFTG